MFKFKLISSDNKSELLKMSRPVVFPAAPHSPNVYVLLLLLPETTEKRPPRTTRGLLNVELSRFVCGLYAR